MHFSEHLILLINSTPKSTKNYWWNHNKTICFPNWSQNPTIVLCTVYTCTLPFCIHVFQSRVIRTFLVDLHLRYQLVVVALLPSWDQFLEPWGVRIAIDVHKKWRGHEVGRLLCLLIQNIVVGVTHQWAVISVEKHLLWDLFIKQQIFICSQGRKNNNILQSLPSF